MTWLVGRSFVWLRAVAVCFFVSLLVGELLAQPSSATGSLVLRSPVQAVATINDKGTFLLVPGNDLRWDQIRPGRYQVAVRSGAGQRWQHQVQIQPGQTETLVAVLSSAGSRLDASAPLSPPDTGKGTTAAYVPPPASTPSGLKSVPQRNANTVDRDAQRRRQAREQRLAEQRRQEAESRAQREASQRAREAAESEEKPRRRRRPKVH